MNWILGIIGLVIGISYVYLVIKQIEEKKNKKEEQLKELYEKREELL